LCEFSFIFISDSLGNEILSLGLLSSLKSVGSCGLAVFLEWRLKSVRRNSVPIDSGTLHRLLSPESLLIESKNSIFQLLADLGVSRDDFG
jgi:hypothetical protein